VIRVHSQEKNDIVFPLSETGLRYVKAICPARRPSVGALAKPVVAPHGGEALPAVFVNGCLLLITVRIRHVNSAKFFENILLLFRTGDLMAAMSKRF
jgi:hypothetical protein